MKWDTSISVVAAEKGSNNDSEKCLEAALPGLQRLRQ